MKHLTKNKYWDLVEDYNLDKLLYLLIDRPDIVNVFEDFFWLNNKNQEHREYDLPVCISIYRYIFWCKNNKYHRKDNKPAFIRNNGSKEYYKNGNHIKSEEI